MSFYPFQCFFTHCGWYMILNAIPAMEITIQCRKYYKEIIFIHYGFMVLFPYYVQLIDVIFYQKTSVLEFINN